VRPFFVPKIECIRTYDIQTVRFDQRRRRAARAERANPAPATKQKKGRPVRPFFVPKKSVFEPTTSKQSGSTSAAGAQHERSELILPPLPNKKSVFEPAIKNRAVGWVSGAQARHFPFGTTPRRRVTHRAPDRQTVGYGARGAMRTATPCAGGGAPYPPYKN
jgi:hypothetical protein